MGTKNLHTAVRAYPVKYTSVFRLAGRQETLFLEMAECSDVHQGEDQCCSPGHARERGDQTATPGLMSVPF